MRCFNVSFILPAAVVVVNSVAAQTAIPLVDIKSVDPTIVVELRYAGANNLLGRALYPPGTPALVRPEVASRLVAAQAFLRRYHYQLKIWDAYRPKPVQVQLWRVAHNNDYVANPRAGPGSLHSWGLAVDATLIDTWNRPVTMPTDFDDFTPAAMWHYRGPDPAIGKHVHLLQIAMRDAGFYGLPTEWWHFTIAEWQKYLPRKEAERAMQALGTREDGSGYLIGPGDQINTDPLLGPLQDNGGPTFTHELLPGSPAINAGNPGFTPPPFFDQRGPGFDRVVNSRIDIPDRPAQTRGIQTRGEIRY